MSISAAVDAQRLHQPPGVLVGLVRGGEARQGVGQDVLARQAEQVHRPADDDQRLGRIEAARDADDRPLGAARLQALRQALDLDVVGLVAIVAQLGRIRRHVGKALDGALERRRCCAARRARSRPCGSARPSSASSIAQSAKPLLRIRSWRMRPRSTSARTMRRVLREALATRRAGRRTRRSRPGRPRPGRSSIRRGRPPSRRRPRCRAPTGCRTAGGAPRPCRW